MVVKKWEDLTTRAKRLARETARCRISGRYSKIDDGGKQYCQFYLLEENIPEPICKYKGKVKYFEFNKDGIIVQIPYYCCHRE